MSKKHKCFRKFINALDAESSRESYGYKFQKFMRFAVEYNYVDDVENFEKLLELDAEKSDNNR